MAILLARKCKNRKTEKNTVFPYKIALSWVLTVGSRYVWVYIVSWIVKLPFAVNVFFIGHFAGPLATIRGCSFFTLHTRPEYFDLGYETFPAVSLRVMKHFGGFSEGLWSIMDYESFNN